MYETLLRPQDVNQISPLQHVSEIADRIKQSEMRREEKRIKQIANSRLKRKRGQESPEEHPDDVGSKRARAVIGTSLSAAPESSIVREPSQPPESVVPMSAPSKITVFKTISEVRGHTSYLTFACLLPSQAPAEVDAGARTAASPEASRSREAHSVSEAAMNV